MPALIELTDLDHLPELTFETIDEYLTVYEAIDTNLNDSHWLLATVSGSIEKFYGDGTFKTLASHARCSTRRIRQLAQTYRVFKDRKRSQILKFTHHQMLAEALEQSVIGSIDVWLNMAEEKEWSTRELEQALKKEADSKGIDHGDLGGGGGNGAAYDNYSKAPKLNEDALNAWNQFMAHEPCWVTGNEEDTVLHHIKVIPSADGGYLNRRQGLARYAVIPLARHLHEGGDDSIHKIGEDEFFDKHLQGRVNVLECLLKQFVLFVNRPADYGEVSQESQEVA